MDRIALSKRIGGLADVFAAGSPIRRELEAMSYALEHMQDEKFATILNEGYEADDKEAFLNMKFPAPHGSRTLEKRDERIQQQIRGGGPKRKTLTDADIAYLDQLDPQAVQQALKSQQAPVPAGAAPKMASEEEQPIEGSTWSREASDAVIRNLVSDVMGREAMNKFQCCDTGRKLEKAQMPDAAKKQETPSSLKEEQTPNLSESLASGMVEKSHGAVRKEAAEEMVVEEEVSEEPKAEKPKAEKPKAPKSVAQVKKEERDEEEVKKTQEDATDKAEDTAKALKNLEKMTAKKASEEPTASMVMFEDIELTAPMDEISLSEEDARTLGNLFR